MLMISVTTADECKILSDVYSICADESLWKYAGYHCLGSTHIFPVAGAANSMGN